VAAHADKDAATAKTDLAAGFESEVGCLYGLAYKLLRDRSDAEDAVQETAVRAIRSIHTFRGEAALSTWLMRICVNVCRDRIRGLVQQREMLDAARIDTLWRDETYTVDPVTVVVAADDRDRLRRALDRLPPAQRLVLLLHDAAGWPTGEIAEMEGLALPTVKSHLRRARMTMVTLLGQSAGEALA